MAEIKAAHVALEDTEPSALAAKSLLASELRKLVRSSVATGLLEFSEGRTSAGELLDKITAVNDQIIESLIKLD